MFTCICVYKTMFVHICVYMAMFVCVCVYMTMFICTRVYMTMFIVYLCLCLYDNVHLCLCLHDRVHLYLCLYDNVLLPPDERVSQLPHCYAWCHRGIRGADKTKQKSHHSPECCPRWAFNQKNLRSTNEEDGVGALLIRTDRNVKMQVPDWPNMRHW